MQARGKSYKKEVKRYFMWAPEEQKRGKVGKSVLRENKVSLNQGKRSEQVNANKPYLDTLQGNWRNLNMRKLPEQSEEEDRFRSRKELSWQLL